MSRRATVTAVLLAVISWGLLACSNSGDSVPPAEESNAGAAGSVASPPAAAPSSPGAMAGPGQMPAGANALMAEFQQLQQSLGALQQQAMADPAIQEAQTRIQEQIESQMSAADPEYATKDERLQALQTEMSAAQESGDEAAMQAISTEGRTLQAELQQLRTSVLQDEELAADIESFREQLETKMAEINPEAPEMIARVTAIMSQMQGPGGGP